MSEGDYNASSLATPSRDTENNVNNSNGNGAQVGTAGQGATEGGLQPTNNSKNGLAAGSCLAGPENPKTVQRKNLSLTGNEVMVHFDERVVVHTVPYWDPCGETYYDDENENENRGPNCCVIL